MKAWAICAGILPFLVAALSFAADTNYGEYATCPNLLRIKGQYPRYTTSASCWSKVSNMNLETNDPKINADFVELSRKTLTGLIMMLAKDIKISEDRGGQVDQLKFPGIPKERLELVKSTLLTALKNGDNEFGVAYFFDVHGRHGKQTDCNFYSRKGPGIADPQNVVARFNNKLDDCTDPSNDLADIIGRASDLASIRVVDPLDIILFARFPDGKYSKQLATASPSLILFLNMRFGLYDKRTKGLPFEFIRVAVPAFRYKTRVTEDLVKISDKLLGKKDDWSALWTINAARIADPHKIPSGVEIVIPAVPRSDPKGWREFKTGAFSTSEIANKVYGNKDYADFVGVVRAKQFDLAGAKGATFRIPDFANFGKFEPIEIDLVRRTAK